MRHAIERSRTRAPCATCEREIERNDLRVAEVCNDGRIPNAKYRYHHLECAVDAQPRLVREIVIAGSFDPALVAEPLALNLRLQDKIESLEQTLRQPEPRDDEVAAPDPAIDSLMVGLENDPEDRAALAVLGDVLAERGDPRGELIALDLAIERAGRGTPEQVLRRDELRGRMLPRVCRIDAAATEWGIGFIRRVDTSLHDSGSRHRLGQAWRHPSLRLLVELGIREYVSRWNGSFPSTLRNLVLGRFDYTDIGELEDPIAEAPRLQRIEIRGHTEMRVANPHVVRIELGPTARPILDPGALPALAEISLDHALGRERTSARDRLAAIADAGWLARLRELGIHDTIDRDCIDVLRAGLGGRRIPRIDVSRTVVPADCVVQLRGLCEQLVGSRVAPAVGARVEHDKLGVGTISRMFDGKLEIDFDDHGRRVFREDSPSLQIGGSREVL